RMLPDSTRVLARFFMPGKADRAASIIDKVAGFSEKEATRSLEDVLRRFAPRHRNISSLYESHYERIREMLGRGGSDTDGMSIDKKMLIGSYFTMEYSIESAAFFNPSIVIDPYQPDLPEGHTRVILSFRATGEGHLSSIVFRGGVLTDKNEIIIDSPGRLVDVAETVNRHTYDKADFLEKLSEMKISQEIAAEVLDSLGTSFKYGAMRDAIAELGDRSAMTHAYRKVVNAVEWLANSHYDVTFSRDTGLSERVIYPVSETESNGLEDARFVRFSDGDSVLYYATYTAYNGQTILPKLLVTEDFYQFKAVPLHGEMVQNKGMSLFPRKVNNRYAMIGRCDGVNLYILYSDDIHYWSEAIPLASPLYPWEIVQIGNSGSPIETSEGWLLVNHGVGPMRTYCLSALLLDLEDPSRIIGRLPEPLLFPDAEEREGYVPNVVYSCGSILHAGELVIPYAMADSASSFATIPLESLLAELKRSG
ncbi:MAG: glycosidase, partial [Spirochaetaceae bacterium]|nr:glycosidase [Spirochaetaceae bacterium]